MSGQDIRRYWDERAEENPYYFVDNRLSYSEPDLDRFWADGSVAIERLLGSLGVELQPADDVVEVGCGVGRLTRAIAERASTVRAVDVSERMIEAARELNPGLDGVEWLVGNGTTLEPIPDESADACISDVVFQHIPDPAITLGYVREIARVLRPGGWAAFQVSNDPRIHRPRPLAERVRTGLRAVARRGPRGQAHPAWLGSAVELDELREHADSGGAAVERVEGAGTQYCYVLLRKRG